MTTSMYLPGLCLVSPAVLGERESRESRVECPLSRSSHCRTTVITADCPPWANCTLPHLSHILTLGLPILPSPPSSSLVPGMCSVSWCEAPCVHLHSPLSRPPQLLLGWPAVHSAHSDSRHQAMEHLPVSASSNYILTTSMLSHLSSVF